MVSKAGEAKNDFLQNIQWPHRRFTWCGDYCQNIDVPHFGSEQPGETYYYSPLSVSCFGLVDHSTGILSAFCYTEGQGKKGGNNVSSLIFKKLKDDGILDLARTQGPGAEFNLIFDNCAGQNKNRMVLRFAQYLVDTDIFLKVNVIFLVMGHTKNICDRRFKDMKKNFHLKNVYSYAQLIKVLGKDNEKYVKVNRVEPEEFFNWDKFFHEKNYKKAIKGISKYHCFFYSTALIDHMEKKLTIECQAPDREKIKKFKKNATDNERTLWKEDLKSSFPEVEVCTGIVPIKQVELYLKWRPLLPDEYKDEMCPKPSDQVMEKVKNDKKDKAKGKLTIKKRGGDIIS